MKFGPIVFTMVLSDDDLTDESIYRHEVHTTITLVGVSGFITEPVTGLALQLFKITTDD